MTGHTPNISRTAMPFSALRLASDEFTNPRTKRGLDRDSLLALARDILQRDLDDPLLVTADGLVLGGQRRWNAIRLIINEPDAVADGDPELLERAEAWTLYRKVPVTVRHDADDLLEQRIVALSHNLQRQDLSSYEEAAAIAELAGDLPSQAEIARRLGKSKTHVSRMLSAWRGASAALLKAWKAELVPWDLVRTIAAKPEPEQDLDLAAYLEKRGSGSRKERSQARQARGGHGRPGVDRVRELVSAAPKPRTAYERGVLAALRYVLGDAEEKELRLRDLGGDPT